MAPLSRLVEVAYVQIPQVGASTMSWGSGQVLVDRGGHWLIFD
jgi:hypothetical protein